MEINLNANNTAPPPNVDTQAPAPAPAETDKPVILPDMPRDITKAINDALTAFGIKQTEDNINLALLLLKNEMPVTLDNLKLVNQAAKLMGTDESKIMFFIDNQIRINPKNMDLLQGFAEHKTLITDMLSRLVDSVLEIKDTPLRDGIIMDLILKPATTPDTIIKPETTTPQSDVKPATTPDTIIKPETTTPPQPDVKPATPDTIIKPETTTPPQPDVKPATTPDTIIKPETTTPPQPDVGGGVHTAPTNVKTTTTPQPDAKPATPQPQIEKLLQQAPGPKEAEIIKEALIKTYPQLEKEIKQIADTVVKDTQKQTPAARFEILEQITRLFPETVPERGKVFDIFTPKENAPLKELILSKFRINPANLTKEEFNALIKNIDETLTEITRKYADIKDISRPLAQIAEIKESMSFLSHIKNDVFIQIPLAFNETAATGELYVFRDRKNNKQKGGRLSALIALDTENLGRFETYIVKQGRGVALQFRLQSPECEALVKEHIQTLHNALDAKGLYISGITYKKAAESFSLLDKEPDNDIRITPFERMVFDKKM